MILLGVGLVSLLVGGMVTLIVITIVGAERKLRAARRQSEGKQ